MRRPAALPRPIDVTASKVIPGLRWVPKANHGGVIEARLGDLEFGRVWPFNSSEWVWQMVPLPGGTGMWNPGEVSDGVDEAKAAFEAALAVWLVRAGLGHVVVQPHEPEVVS